MRYRKSAIRCIRHLNRDRIYREGDNIVSVAAIDRNFDIRGDGDAGPVYRRSDSSSVS